MINVTRALREKKVPAEMIMQIHDELVFECREDARALAFEIIKKEMEGALPLQVPLKVELGWGKNWNEAHA